MSQILVVEDSPTQALVLGNLLRENGYEVEIARDGAEGLARLRSGSFDLVMSDVVMPKMDGYSLCRAIREEPELASLPVILLTTLNEPSDVIRGLEVGADNFITKPFEPEPLLRRVQQILLTRALRASRRSAIGVELEILGRRVLINSDKQQMLDMLLSTFEEVLLARQREIETRLSQETLARSYEVLQSALDALPLSICLLDRGGAIRAINATWRRLVADSGLSWPASGVGQDYLATYGALIPDPAARERLARELRLSSEVPGRELLLDLPLRLGRGTRWHSLRITRLDTPGEPLLVAVHEDVTGRREGELRARVENQVVRILNAADDLEQAAPDLLRALCEGMGFAAGELWSGAGERMNLSAGWYSDPERFSSFAAEGRASRGPDLASPAGPSGGTPAIAHELLAHAPLSRREQALALGLRSAVSVPILVQREEAGALLFFSADEARPGTSRRALLESTAVQVGQLAARVRAREALRASERAAQAQAALHRLVLDSLGDGVIVVDSRGRILLANPAAQRLALPGGQAVPLGQWSETYGIYEADGQTPIPPADLSLARALRGEATGAHEVVLRPPADPGLVRHLSVTSHPLFGDSGAVQGGVLVARDITERRRMAQALEERETQLRQAQKLEAIGRLAGGVAHDFNNMLVVILSYAGLIDESLPPGSPEKDDLAQVRGAAERAADLTRRLLAFSRQQVLKPALLDLGEVVRELEGILRRVVGEDVAFITRYASELDPVYLDKSQTEQVIMNLVVNARDAMPAGGKLIIETSPVEIDEVVEGVFSKARPGRYAQLTVTDTGMGMDAATQARIFEPFFTTKEPGKGTGLGLATVHGIVEQSGGYIWLYSEPGMGTTFKLLFPRHEGVPEPARPAPPAPARARAANIVVVEDEASVRHVTERILRRRGFTVTALDNAAAALELAADPGQVIDLLATDAVMPEMSGLELTERIRQIRPDLRVLVMSGYAHQTLGHHGVMPPDASFLEKPFTADTLVRAVREAMWGPDAG